MQCITVKQPWATLLVHGATRYLVRKWRTFHRGPLAIQAGAKLKRPQVELCCDPDMRAILHRFGYDYAMELPLQSVLGCVNVIDCKLVTEETRRFFAPSDPASIFGRIQPGRWVWTCTDAEPLPHPVPQNGRLGVYTISDAVFMPFRGNEPEPQPSAIGGNL